MQNQALHIGAETKYIAANGIQFAYRAFGKTEGTPLIFLQHFTGTMDNWDPLVTDGIAASRPVILFNNTGVSSSSGTTPHSVRQMAMDAISFITALGYEQVDLLGYSLGGFIAQEIAVEKPSLVRNIILAGTGPQGGTGYDVFRDFIADAFSKEGAEVYFHIFAEDSPSSKNAIGSVLGRVYQRAENRDPESNMQTIIAQTQAIEQWGQNKEGAPDLLGRIYQPVLVVNGSNDHMFPSINSYTLFQKLPLAQLSLYPDASHGGIFQYASLFVEQAVYFLENGIRTS